MKIRPNYQKFNQLPNDITIEVKTLRRTSMNFNDNPEVIQKMVSWQMIDMELLPCLCTLIHVYVNSDLSKRMKNMKF